MLVGHQNEKTQFKVQGRSQIDSEPGGGCLRFGPPTEIQITYLQVKDRHSRCTDSRLGPQVGTRGTAALHI